MLKKHACESLRNSTKVAIPQELIILVSAVWRKVAVASNLPENWEFLCAILQIKSSCFNFFQMNSWLWDSRD